MKLLNNKKQRKSKQFHKSPCAKKQIKVIFNKVKEKKTYLHISVSLSIIRSVPIACFSCITSPARIEPMISGVPPSSLISGSCR